jgi:osmoprotectant transport system ATP-binding protein
MIEFIDIRKRYDAGEGIAVDGVSLRVERGELCVLLGPSGCGKTTLLRMANRLVEPTSGTIMIDGRDVMHENPVELRRRIGYAIQNVGLFPHRTVAENIATTPELLGMPRERIAARVDELLAMMQLDPASIRNRYPAELSGGQAQRVGVARALAADPPLLLMDEPFGAIDPINRAAIRDEFLALQRRLRKTILFVSHDIQEALHLADRIVLMRAGTIEQHGTPAELLSAPATPFVERFFGTDRRMLLLEALHVSDAIAATASPTISPTIAHDAPLKDALLALLTGGHEQLAVTGGDGASIGAVTLGSIQGRLARAFAEESAA